MARPTKLTPEVIERICNGIRHGLTYQDAARHAGIGKSTFYRWKAKAENAKSGLFRELREAIKKANVEAEGHLLGIIQKTAKGGLTVTETVEEYEVKDGEKTIIKGKTTRKTTLPTWTAAAWILERRFPDKYGRFVQPRGDEEDDPFTKWADDYERARELYGHELTEEDEEE